MRYGGFWARAGAKCIDHAIIGAANTAFVWAWKEHSPLDPKTFKVVMVVMQLMFQAGFSSAFLERFGATPGKMALGLKVVTAGGERIGGMRSWARGLAELLSGILYIGYLMAAKDPEGCTLHDWICGTRVVRTRD